MEPVIGNLKCVYAEIDNHPIQHVHQYKEGTVLKSVQQYSTATNRQIHASAYMEAKKPAARNLVESTKLVAKRENVNVLMEKRLLELAINVVKDVEGGHGVSILKDLEIFTVNQEI